MKLTVLLFLAMASTGVVHAQNIATKSVLNDDYVVPANKGAGESSTKLVLQFSNPYTISTSKINENKDSFTPWEKSGNLYFQDGQWVPQSKVISENRTFCELKVYNGAMYGGYDSFEEYLEHESKGIFSDIVIKENMTVLDVNYYSGFTSSSGKYTENNSATILIGRWIKEYVNGQPVIKHLGGNSGDTAAAIRVYKNFTGAAYSSSIDLAVRVADLKSCFGSDLSMIEVPAEFLVP